jgi:hypothetical protein
MAQWLRMKNGLLVSMKGVDRFWGHAYVEPTII